MDLQAAEELVFFLWIDWRIGVESYKRGSGSFDDEMLEFLILIFGRKIDFLDEGNRMIDIDIFYNVKVGDTYGFMNNQGDGGDQRGCKKDQCWGCNGCCYLSNSGDMCMQGVGLRVKAWRQMII